MRVGILQRVLFEGLFLGQRGLGNLSWSYHGPGICGVCLAPGTKSGMPKPMVSVVHQRHFSRDSSVQYFLSR
jgi:hypothetical protein